MYIIYLYTVYIYVLTQTLLCLLLEFTSLPMFPTDPPERFVSSRRSRGVELFGSVIRQRRTHRPVGHLPGSLAENHIDAAKKGSNCNELSIHWFEISIDILIVACWWIQTLCCTNVLCLLSRDSGHGLAVLGCIHGPLDSILDDMSWMHSSWRYLHIKSY